MGDFVGMKNYFKWMNIYVLPETYRAMTGVVTECLKVHQMCLFPTGYGKKYMSLDEFESSQTQVTSNVCLNGFNIKSVIVIVIFFNYYQLIKHLKGPWLENVTYILRMCLGDLGKGWFNINQRQYEYYEIAKLLRMMELVKHIMQVSENLIKQFLTFIYYFIFNVT